MTQHFVLQLAGHPGSGKSTLARAVGDATSAVVLDKDVFKTAMLESGLPEKTASGLSYDVLFATGRSLVGRHSIVLDSPAYFPDIIANGRAIADSAGVPYYIIECACEDRDELQRRLDIRQRVASQSTVTVLDDPLARPGTAPLTVPHLQIDMSRPLETCVADALEYIDK